ncbi:MAG: tRNA (cytidine(34)-2'-O)-methyltransferase [bacterium]|nr:tRNA (cytidine(34)-2'-O)-methyltransferase [bacterium]
MNTNFSADVVLVEPKIPQNTGSIARTCAVLGCPLHLVEPLGFSLEDRYVRRAGMDYWKLVDVRIHKDIEAFYEANPEGNYFYFSKKGKKGYHTFDYSGRNYFIFGSETVGLPESLTVPNQDVCLRIPMLPGVRSLNLSNAVSIVLYEAFRQTGFPGLEI